MLYDDESTTVITFIVLAIIGALVLLGFYSYECSTKANMQELEWSFGPIQGCMVREKGGKWIDYQRLRYME